MPNNHHDFTDVILGVLSDKFPNHSDVLFKTSPILQYINKKTKAASKGAKSRPSFGNLYAIYVLIEDYLNGNFHQTQTYSSYEGAQFSQLFKRQRELPFGAKLQNHALNHRLNKEFEKFFPTIELAPIIRDSTTNRYWINENLIDLKISSDSYNIAEAIIEIIDKYVEARQSSFLKFIEDCNKIVESHSSKPSLGRDFVRSLLRPNVDARIFEIVSFSIMKAYYADQSIYWGWELDALEKENLSLFKTGRTNANDGGIDFVMKPLGRFFQVTETTDVTKYFLDIDKVQRFPITFVVKTEIDTDKLKTEIEKQAKKKYAIDLIVKKYMDCVEEIINIPILMRFFDITVSQNSSMNVIQEILVQSKLEFNLEP